MTDDELGPPRWLYAWLVVVGLIVIACAVFVVVRQQAATDLAHQNTQILEANRQASARSDCRANISLARRDVLDQLNLLLDTDRTVHDQILGDALLGLTTGQRPTQADIDNYNRNHADLVKDLQIASELVPRLPSVDDVTDHGGRMPVLQPDRSVTSRKFAPCPKVAG